MLSIEDKVMFLSKASVEERSKYMHIFDVKDIVVLIQEGRVQNPSEKNVELLFNMGLQHYIDIFSKNIVSEDSVLEHIFDDDEDLDEKCSPVQESLKKTGDSSYKPKPPPRRTTPAKTQKLAETKYDENGMPVSQIKDFDSRDLNKMANKLFDF